MKYTLLFALLGILLLNLVVKSFAQEGATEATTHAAEEHTQTAEGGDNTNDGDDNAAASLYVAPVLLLAATFRAFF